MLCVMNFFEYYGEGSSLTCYNQVKSMAKKKYTRMNWKRTLRTKKLNLRLQSLQ